MTMSNENAVATPTTSLANAVAKASAAKTAKKEAKKPAKKPAKKAKGDAATAKGPGALREYAPGYVKDTEHKTAAGNASVHCGDETAQKLLGKTLDQVYAMAAKICEIPEKELRAKYAKLNLGMQRMNLGNKIRGVLNAK
jgi:hypothetical protein